MTDAKLIKTAAEQVMSWAGWGKWRGPTPDWNPLTSDEDAFRLVDELKDRQFRFLLEYRTPLRGGPSEWVVRFGEGAIVADPDRRRAIVLAALESVGVKIGESSEES